MFEGEASANLVEQAQLVAVASEKKKAAKKLLEIAQEEFNGAEAKLLLLMDRDDVRSLVVGKTTLYSKEVTYVSINRAREAEAHAWLAENGYGELVRATVNSKTLSSAYKELIELDKELPTDLFNINPKSSVGVRKKA